MTYKAVIILVFICILIPAKVYSHSQVLSTWFRENDYSEQYRNIEEELHQVFQEIEDLNIPSNLLIEKLNEGISKKIDSSHLLNALKEETERLKTSRKILETIKIYTFTDEEAGILYKGISIFLLGGINEENIRIFITKSMTKDSPISTFLSLGRTLLSILSVTELSIEHQHLLGNSLLQSNLKESGYSAISSIFLKGILKRLENEEITFIIIDALENREGIIRIENEIERRGKSR